MEIALGGLIAALLLLPGFLVVKARQAAREHTKQDNFEATVVSLAFSVAILAAWLGLNALYEALSATPCSFSSHLRRWLAGDGPAELLTSDTVVAISSYVTTVALAVLGTFAWVWVGGPTRTKRFLRLYRFTEHLTPWEDYVHLYANRWVAVRLVDGRTLVGRMGIASHAPFAREVIITGAPGQAVDTYTSEHKKEIHTRDVEGVYVSADNIVTIEAIADPENRPPPRRPLEALLPVSYLTAAVAWVLASYSVSSLAVGYEHVGPLPFVFVLAAILSTRCVFRWME